MALTLLVPVYNEAENFPNLIAEIERNVPAPYDLLIAYDFDADTTLPIARDYQRTRPNLKLVKNRYKGVVGAIRSGFEEVQEGPVLVVMADLSDDLVIVPKLLELYQSGYRIVCASRYMPGGKQLGGPLLKRTLSRLAGMFLFCVVRFPTRDATNNFRLYDASLVRELKIESVGGFELALELTAKAFRRGEPITEYPTTWRDRTAGESRFQLKKWLPKYLYWFTHAITGL